MSCATSSVMRRIPLRFIDTVWLIQCQCIFEEDVHADDKQDVGEFLDGDCEDECSHFSKHVAMNFQLWMDRPILSVLSGGGKILSQKYSFE